MSNILNLRKLKNTQFRICEILVDLSKQHITQEEALKKIDKCLNDNIVGRSEYKDLEKIEKENIRLKFENQELKFNETMLSNYGYDLKLENEKLKKAIEKEISILEKRRFNAYACDDYKTHSILNEVIEELKEVLDNEIN